MLRNRYFNPVRGPISVKIHNEQTKIVYDTNIVDYIKELKPKRVCVTSDPFMLKLGVVAPLEQYFKTSNIPYKIFSDVKPNPSQALVTEGLAHIFDTKPSLIIAVGGGSAIDLAKAIMYFCLQIKTGFIAEDELVKPVFIAVPTTAGTGSEVTNFAVITDDETGAKQVIRSDLMQPDAAVLDVDLTMTAPPHITADTGFDALTHAIEAYVSRLSTPFSDAYALQAAQMIFDNLVPAFVSKDREAKRNMQLAASIAGLAFNHSALGLNHSIAHAAGAIFHLPHGRANALILPALMRFNMKDEPTLNRYSQMGKALGFVFETPGKTAAALVRAVEILKKMLELPAGFADIGIDRKQLEAELSVIAQEAVNDYCTPGHPFEVTKDDVKSIVRTLI